MSNTRLVTAGYFDVGNNDPDLAAMAGYGDDGGASSGGMYQILGDEPISPALLAQVQARNSLAFRESQPTKWREAVIGFGPVTIPAGATVDVPSAPQVVFRGERLTIPSDIAGQISVLDCKVGKDSQFASVGAVPGRSFDEKSTGNRLRMDTAQISQQVVLRVQNTGGAPVVFTASINGASLEL